MATDARPRAPARVNDLWRHALGVSAPLSDGTRTEERAIAKVLGSLGGAVAKGAAAKDPNLQLKLGGVGMTSVQGTGQTGIRTSAFKKGVLGNEKSATKFPRPGMNEVCPVMACVLLAVPHSYCKGRIGTRTQDVGLLRSD